MALMKSPIKKDKKDKKEKEKDSSNKRRALFGEAGEDMEGPELEVVGEPAAASAAAPKMLALGDRAQGAEGKGEGKGDKGKGRTMKCNNCGSSEHLQAACPKPRVPWEERPCRQCGDKGHLSSSCPQREAKEPML